MIRRYVRDGSVALFEVILKILRSIPTACVTGVTCYSIVSKAFQSPKPPTSNVEDQKETHNLGSSPAQAESEVLNEGTMAVAINANIILLSRQHMACISRQS